MQDIIPPQKRKSIRDIPLPDGKNKIVERDFTNSEPLRAPQPPREEEPIKIRRAYEESFNNEEEEEVEEAPARHFKEPRTKKSGPSKRKIIALSAIALLIIFGAFLSRSGAKVFVYAKELSQSANVSTTLPYAVEEISLEKTVSVQATGEETVQEKAKGRITIYNEYEEEEQRLLKNTRFESSGGLIYRIPESVVVPGSKRDSSGNVVAGTLEVEVVADEVGEKYNIGAGKFTVPGFDGLPQFDSFYAKSEKPIEGGFDGIRKVISESDRQEAENSLKTQLQTALITEAKAKTTEARLVLADDSMIVYEILADKVDGNNVSISARGTIKATAFDFQQFNNTIAKSVIPQFSELENVSIKNIDELNMMVSKQEGENVASLVVAGNVDFVWINDHEALKQIIAGTDKNSLKETVEMFPGITKISSEVRPIWKKTFPEDTSKIEIIDSKN
ncbi:MAG: hypothetical protein WC087_00030 [Candidatus Paceibacterota bacterium]